MIRLGRRAVPTALGPLPWLRGSERQVTAAEGARLALMLHAEGSAAAALVGWLRRIADAGTWLDLEQAVLLDRLARGGYLKGSAVAELFDAHAAATAGLSPAMMGERVALLLERRESWGYLADPPPKPASEARVLEVLKHLRAKGHFAYGVDLEALSESWGRKMGYKATEEIARVVAARLKMGHWAADLAPGGEVQDDIDMSDPIFRVKPLTNEQRANLAHMRSMF